MANQWTQILDLTPSQRAECETMSKASGSGWWRIQKEDIPTFVPETMRNKLDGGVLVLSGSESGTTHLMFGAERVDGTELDVQPFGVAVLPLGASTAMALVHHGKWRDRTIQLPESFLEIASSCRTGSYFFAHPPEGKTSGTLDELGPGHAGAFDAIMRKLSTSSDSAA